MQHDLTRRRLEPEILDHLPARDPRALASRADLIRLNNLMGSARLLSGELIHNAPPARWRLAELGGGDGTLLLKIAQLITSRTDAGADAVLVDQQQLVGSDTRGEFGRCDWSIQVAARDVFKWMEDDSGGVYDVMIANLFLHHFDDEALSRLLAGAAKRCRLFVACEPRRGRLPLLCARLVGLVGCNAVTRHDAVISVRAGFSGNELSTLWPKDDGWTTHERAAGGFSQLFTAVKNGIR